MIALTVSPNVATHAAKPSHTVKQYIQFHGLYSCIVPTVLAIARAAAIVTILA
jgi:hypothetical protein